MLKRLCIIVVSLGVVVLAIYVLSKTPQSKTSIQFYLEAKSTDAKTLELKFRDSDESMLLEKTPVLTEKDIEGAELVLGKDEDESKPVSIEFQLSQRGSKRCTEITGNNINRKIAVVVNGQIIAAPIIKQRVSKGPLFISEKFSFEEAKKIVDDLNKER